VNFQEGTANLKRELESRGMLEAKAQVETLEKEREELLSKPHQQEPERAAAQERIKAIADRLNEISARSVGVSFESLCTSKKPGVAGLLQTPSLGSVVYLFLVVLVLPGVAVALTLSIVEYTGQMRLEQIQSRVQAMDERINAAVRLNEKPANPCSDGVANKLGASSALAIRLSQDTKTPYCFWEYLEPGSEDVVAKDYWGSNNLLEKREYYLGGTLLAEDLFEWGGADCFKRREFFDSQKRVSIVDCFSEAGIAHSKRYRIIGNQFIERSNSMRSGIPPMLRWFFYR
jgi:hypothetical protein